MFRILALGLLIYVIWKMAEGFFSSGKKDNPQNPFEPKQDKNKDDDGFTPFEEVD